MLMVPVLFIAGVLFGYFVVLERAVAVPAELQRRLVRHPPAGQGLLQVRGLLPGRDRSAVPDPRRRAGGHAAGHLHAEAARQEPRLRDPRHRGPRGRRDADARSGDDDAGDGAADRPVRAEHPARALDRPDQAAARSDEDDGTRTTTRRTTSEDDEDGRRRRRAAATTIDDDDPLSAYEDDDDEPAIDLADAAAAVQRASESDAPKLEDDAEDPDPKD